MIKNNMTKQRIIDKLDTIRLIQLLYSRKYEKEFVIKSLPHLYDLHYYKKLKHDLSTHSRVGIVKNLDRVYVDDIKIFDFYVPLVSRYSIYHNRATVLETLEYVDYKHFLIKKIPYCYD